MASYAKVSDILMPPVQVTIQSRLLVEKFAEIAKFNSSLLPAIKVGMVNQKMYAINNLNVIQGCKKTNPHLEIPVQVTNYDNISDITIWHFRESVNEEPLNPLSIFDALNMLEEKGVDKRKAIQLLWLSDTPYEKLFRIEESELISNESIRQLQKITNNLKERKIPPSSIQVPLYVIAKLNKIETKNHQTILVEKIDAMLSCMTDSKFAWPTPEQMDTMYLFIKQDFQDDHHENNNTKTSTQKENSDKYKIDKTKESSGKESAYDEYGDDENFLYPQDITTHLNPQNILQIRHRNFESAIQLREFLSTTEQQRNKRFTLLWGEPAASR